MYSTVFVIEAHLEISMKIHLPFDVAILFLRIHPIRRKILPDVVVYVQGCHCSIFHRGKTIGNSVIVIWGMVAKWNIM